jgi:type IV pilus assembly protein PilV
MQTMPDIMTMVSEENNRGFTLIEVLITIVIIAVGVLGLAGLQMTTLNSQLESYQRAQALLELEDMASRIRANTAVAFIDGGYDEAEDYGLQAEDDCWDKVAHPTTKDRDLCEWNNALAGSGVKLDADNVGGGLGARGCIEYIPGNVYPDPLHEGETIIRLTIAWQGISPTKAPLSSCGEDQYGDDKLRRAASLDVVLADLSP